MKTNTRYVLLADDDIDDQMLFAEIFYQVSRELNLTIVSGSNELFSHLNACKDIYPCLIILDYNIPLVTGLEVIKELKKDSRFSGIPVIVFSTAESIGKQCLDAGAVSCFIKPARISGFIEVMQQMLVCI
ncbi:MAG: hypothetical protein JWQ38_887 [Flavipsychrobacter sp.]|nr:hypothetical protein [Flavipsychrobacter sp.]